MTEPTTTKRRPGRPSRSESGEASSVHVKIRVTPTEAEMLDELRGESSRSAFLREKLSRKPARLTYLVTGGSRMRLVTVARLKARLVEGERIISVQGAADCFGFESKTTRWVCLAGTLPAVSEELFERGHRVWL